MLELNLYVRFLSTDYGRCRLVLATRHSHIDVITTRKRTSFDIIIGFVAAS